MKWKKRVVLTEDIAELIGKKFKIEASKIYDFLTDSEEFDRILGDFLDSYIPLKASPQQSDSQAESYAEECGIMIRPGQPLKNCNYCGGSGRIPGEGLCSVCY